MMTTLQNQRIVTPEDLWRVKQHHWNTVDSRYLDFGYLEQPLISKKKSGPCLNIEIWYQVTKNCG